MHGEQTHVGAEERLVVALHAAGVSSRRRGQIRTRPSAALPSRSTFPRTFPRTGADGTRLTTVSSDTARMESDAPSPMPWKPHCCCVATIALIASSVTCRSSVSLALPSATPASPSDRVPRARDRRTVAEVDELLRAQQRAELLGAKGRGVFGHGLSSKSASSECATTKPTRRAVGAGKVERAGSPEVPTTYSCVSQQRPCVTKPERRSLVRQVANPSTPSRRVHCRVLARA